MPSLSPWLQPDHAGQQYTEEHCHYFAAIEHKMNVQRARYQAENNPIQSFEDEVALYLCRIFPFTPNTIVQCGRL
jgi:hypothetical protein